ncbi:MAG: hypothetical protein ACD_20C00174G0006 [uncultured bacterium]|nr:MAG: hypothetical protein ACD_20C00174G0006 [uncultured bacterium]
MPRRDGTGPSGMGIMTGRGLGRCLAFGLPLVAGAIGTFCFGGRGRGFRNMFKSTGMTGWQGAITSSDELTALKEQANILENNLDNIKERISQLEHSDS